MTAVTLILRHVFADDRFPMLPDLVANRRLDLELAARL